MTGLVGGSANPYPGAEGWWFDDKNRLPHGPYPNQHKALVALFEFMQMQREWREYGHARKQNKSDR